MTAMDAGARGWLVRTSKKHYWRIASWYELSDLMQDGFLIWSMVVKRYEIDTGRVRSRRHLMALFQRCFLNHVNTLSASKHRCTEMVVSDLLITDRFLSEMETWDLAFGVIDHGAHDTVVSEMPTVARDAVRKIEAGSCKPMHARYRRRTNGTRETLNDRLARFVGINPSVDIVTPLRDSLKSA